MFKISCLALILFGVSQAGCAPTYTYGGKTYTDRATAEAAANQHMRSLVDKVESRTTSLTEEGSVYIPSRETVLRFAVTTDYEKSEAAAYVSKVLYYGFANVARMIERRNLFGNLDVSKSDGTHKLPGPDGHPVVYLHMPDENESQWYYVSGKTHRTPLDFDTNSADEFEGYYFLIETIEDLLVKEQ